MDSTNDTQTIIESESSRSTSEKRDDGDGALQVNKEAPLNDNDNQKGPVDPPPQRKSNDLIFDEGFPVLNSFVLPTRQSTTTKLPKAQYDPSIVPRYPFASFPSALTIHPHQLPNLLHDFEHAFDARTKEDDAAYSTGATFFMPAVMKPRCALVDLALRIFKCHTEGLLVGRDYDLERSGAEWWTLVLDSSAGEDGDGGGDSDSDDGGGKPASTSTPTSPKKEGEVVKKDNKHGNHYDNGHYDNDYDNDDDDEEEDEDDEVGMHFDADYGLEEQLPNIMLHPRIATVTYLSDVGVPTLVLNRRSPPPADVQKLSLNGPIDSAWLSCPMVGKHIAFDGRLLHGAPGEFFPAGSFDGKQHGGDDDGVANADDDERSTKRRKLDNEMIAASTTTNLSQSIPSRGTKQRVTFLVNIWLNHCPIDAELLDDDLIAGMKTSWQEDCTVVDGDRFEFADGAVTGEVPNKSYNRKRDSTTIDSLGYTPPFRWSLPNVTKPDNKLPKQQITGMEDKSKWAGIETSVICNREVAMQFRSTMEDYHRVSRAAFDADGKSIELSLTEGAVHLEVGDEVEDSSSDEDE